MKTLTYVCPISKKRKQVTLPEPERHTLVVPTEKITMPIGWGRIILEVATVNPLTEQVRMTHEAALGEAKSKMAESGDMSAEDQVAVLAAMAAKLNDEVPMPEHEVVWSRTVLEPLSDEAMTAGVDGLRKAGFDV